MVTASENHPEATTHHFMLDHLGMPRVLTDAQGQFVSTHSYFGFGAEIKGGARWRGHGEDGLHRARAGFQ